MDILVARDLKKYYGRGEGLTKALDGVDLSIREGEFVTIVGTSGSGKTTLLNMLGGLDTPTEGSVLVGGMDLSKLDGDKLTAFRRRNIGFVFQSYNLVPILNVYENIALPVELDGKKADRQFIDYLLGFLSLGDKRDNLPGSLSGGQQQRVAIARSLAMKPKIILADEPTGNLDTKTSAEVLALMREVARQFSQTIVMITHNDEIAQMADRTIRIEDGRIVGSAQPWGRQNYMQPQPQKVQPRQARAYDYLESIRTEANG